MHRAAKTVLLLDFFFHFLLLEAMIAEQINLYIF